MNKPIAYTYEGMCSTGSYSPPFWELKLSFQKPEPSEFTRNIRPLYYEQSNRNTKQTEQNLQSTQG